MKNEPGVHIIRAVAGLAPRISGLALGLALASGALADVGAAKTIAAGLSNPRGIAFAPSGELWVVEAGRGGPGPCIPGAANPAVERCYGETGAITRILPEGGFERVLTGLPSVALPDGTVEGGPTDVSFLGASAYVTMGLGGDPVAVRQGLGGKAHLLGKVLHVTPGGQYQTVGDVAGHESRLNPAGGTVDSNPYGIVALPGRRIVADAGGNSVIELRPNRRTRTFAIPPAGANGQSVPTSVAEGPDGALYVGLLTGFPFFRGTAQVLRISSDGSSVQTFTPGLTAVVDVTFDNGGAMYVLEIAAGQVPPFPPPNPGVGIGRLLRQCPGGAPQELLAGLTFAAGVAIGPDDAAYLTNFSVSTTNGEVLRLPLTPCP